jgi:hypothetical protein
VGSESAAELELAVVWALVEALAIEIKWVLVKEKVLASFQVTE